MNTYKVTFSNGDYLYTQLNASIEEAKAYYLGTEECAWYNSEMQVCAVLAGTSQLQQIVEKVTELES